MACGSWNWTAAMVVAFGVISVVAVTIGWAVGLSGGDKIPPSFTVDHRNNTFLLDGRPFRYVSGSFHYFRSLPTVWEERLKIMRFAGLNVISTYVEWSLHNPQDGVYNFENLGNIEKFLDLAGCEGLYVILRPGPYICAERDNGGLPYWLFTKYPDIKPRTSDPNFKLEVSKWYAELMKRMKPYFYGNGGSIIMVQIENEYGAFPACDRDYLNWLHEETDKYVDNKAVLFTTDQPNDNMRCGKIDGVLATTDFGLDRIHEIDKIWSMLREVQPTGPLVNSEFYTGWLTHWNEKNQRREAQKLADGLKVVLETGASVNFYMFCGGTNFGFTSGANNFGFAQYMPDVTSYDYDAIVDESGAMTQKYILVREILSEFFQVPASRFCSCNLATRNLTRVAFGKVQMRPILELLTPEGRKLLGKAPTTSDRPLTFEKMNEFSGLILYETPLPELDFDPTELRVLGIRDRALVYVDEMFVGTLSRESNLTSLALHKGWGKTLQLLVENQGRINYIVTDDIKGIVGDVEVRKLDGNFEPLTNWTMTPFPLDEIPLTEALTNQTIELTVPVNGFQSSYLLVNGPVLYYAEFEVKLIGDTYLNPTRWGKGVAFVNNFNLGRYWPITGPQITLYVPKDLLRMGMNTLMLLEYQQSAPCVEFSGVPQLDGPDKTAATTTTTTTTPEQRKSIVSK